ncbi:MAG: 50S ribosomal protein L22 [Phycisphaerales bacterium]
MKIRGEQLKKRASEAGLSIEQLAEAVNRKGLEGDRAVSAIGNWMRNSDHPAAKAQDVRRLAGALGCQVADIARFESVFHYHRGSPRKVGLIVDMIRGKRIDQALDMLTFTTKRAAVDVKQALMAAKDSAEQFDADVTALVVTDSRVDKGPTMKRFQPKDRGRAHPIKKRMSHITIGVEVRS